MRDGVGSLWTLIAPGWRESISNRPVQWNVLEHSAAYERLEVQSDLTGVSRCQARRPVEILNDVPHGHGTARGEEMVYGQQHRFRFRGHPS